MLTARAHSLGPQVRISALRPEKSDTHLSTNEEALIPPDIIAALLSPPIVMQWEVRRCREAKVVVWGCSGQNRAGLGCKQMRQAFGPRGLNTPVSSPRIVRMRIVHVDQPTLQRP
jgi:hypothetical protein